MPRAIRPWFRFYVEAFPDRKLRRLQPEQRWIWVAILGAARESPEPGKLYIAPGLPMSTQELADYAGVKLRLVEAALSAMSDMSMVQIDQSGLVTVTNWDSRQFESDDVTQRTRDHRERSRERSNDVPGNAPETETETETERTSGEAPPRAEVERLCLRLADRIEANGAKRPTITAKWRTAARLLLDADQRTEEQVAWIIDWCQRDEFWRANILSMPKLREKFDQIKLKAVPPTNVLRLDRNGDLILPPLPVDDVR